MEYDLEDFKNLLALKNQLINAPLNVLMEDYKNDYDLYLTFLDSVNMLIDTDSGFLLFSDSCIEKIFSIINIYRFDCNDKNVFDCINEIIDELNKIISYKPLVKKVKKYSYLASQEEARKIKIIDDDTLIQLMAYDAVCFLDLVNGEDIKPGEDYVFLSSLNYLIHYCPELFEDENVKNNAMSKIDVLLKKGWPFNFNGRKYSKETKGNLQKVKTLN